MVLVVKKSHTSTNLFLFNYGYNYCLDSLQNIIWDTSIYIYTISNTNKFNYYMAIEYIFCFLKTQPNVTKLSLSLHTNQTVFNTVSNCIYFSNITHLELYDFNYVFSDCIDKSTSCVDVNDVINFMKTMTHDKKIKNLTISVDTSSIYATQNISALIMVLNSTYASSYITDIEFKGIYVSSKFVSSLMNFISSCKINIIFTKCVIKNSYNLVDWANNFIKYNDCVYIHDLNVEPIKFIL